MRHSEVLLKRKFWPKSMDFLHFLVLTIFLRFSSRAPPSCSKANWAKRTSQSGEIVVVSNRKSLKVFAPGEARTHGLQTMRLTRCLLRYGGKVPVWQTNSLRLNIGCHRHKKIVLPTGGLEPPIFGLGDRRLIH